MLATSPQRILLSTLVLLGPLASGATRLGPITSEGLIGADIRIGGNGSKPAVPTRRGKRT
jgi:hypothetical protein